MSSPESLFREEALRHYRRGDGPGDVVRLSPAWTTWAFAALLLAFAGLVVTVLTIQLHEEVRAPALATTRGVVLVFVPVAYDGDIEVGDDVRLNGQGVEADAVVSEIGRVRDEDSLSPQVQDLLSGASQPVIPLTTTPSGGFLASVSTGNVPINATIELDEPLLTALIPGLTELLGGSRG